jgi:hypothetical protein
MNNTTLQLKIKQRLNKLDSQDYDNLQCWQIVEAFNKAQVEWIRRQVQGVNITKTGDEQTKMRIDDLQKLLKEEHVTLTKKDLYMESETLPTDYLFFKRINGHASKGCCENPMAMTITYLAEEENVPLLLGDELKKPSFEWGETFCTLVGNKVRIYTNNDFEIHDVKLMYYRLPTFVQLNGCVDPYTTTQSTEDVVCEFKDDVAEILVDAAVNILSGDIEYMNQYQVSQQSVQENS